MWSLASRIVSKAQAEVIAQQRTKNKSWSQADVLNPTKKEPYMHGNQLSDHIFWGIQKKKAVNVDRQSHVVDFWTNNVVLIRAIGLGIF